MPINSPWNTFSLSHYCQTILFFAFISSVFPNVINFLKFSFLCLLIWVFVMVSLHLVTIHLEKLGFFFLWGWLACVVVILLHTIKAQWEYVLGSYVGCSIDSKDVMCSVLWLTLLALWHYYARLYLLYDSSMTDFLYDSIMTDFTCVMTVLWLICFSHCDFSATHTPEHVCTQHINK